MQKRSLTLFDLSPGKVLLDRWKIVRTNRTGGMAATFAAEDLDGTLRELQIYSTVLFERRGDADEFAAAMARWLAVKHPHVLRAVAVERHEDGSVLYATDMPLGRALRELKVEGEAWDPARVVALGVELCAGLSEIHANGLVHGDVKPHTVHISDDGRAVLVDCGITPALWSAKHLGEKTALIGTPFLSGFYSKDFIIEAVHESHRWGATYAYGCVLIGVFVTAFYTFRMVFMTFHGAPRWSADHDNDHDHGHGHGGAPHESPWVVTLPLVLLAIPSLAIGYLTVQPVLFGGYFGEAIRVLERNDVLAELATHFHDPASFALSAIGHPPLWLAFAGVVSAWYLFLRNPQLAARIGASLRPIGRVLDNKYYFDWFNENVIAAGSRLLGRSLWRAGDQALIDGALVNGSAHLVGALAATVRRVQTGYLYTYAFWMMIGLAALLAWFLLIA